MKASLIFLLFPFSVFAQTITVTYDMRIDVSGTSPEPYRHTLELTNSNGQSVQKGYAVDVIYDKNVRVGNASTKTIRIGDDTTYVFKDFTKNRLISEESIFTKTFAVEDQLNLFDWKIEKDRIKILEHSCRKATTVFRGRKYEAYFTDDIPISDGPEKFNGLPGRLILKVRIIDDEVIYHIEAIKVAISPRTVELANPFSGKTTTPFKTYRQEFIRKYEQMEAYSQNSNGISVKRNRLEILD